MQSSPTLRRLAAIMSADVVGYTRLMRADEAGTLAALKRHRETLFDPAVAGHRGRIVKLVGDGALVEFASVVDAVDCAVAIQRAMRSAVSDGDPPLTLRIGINLGDIVIDGDDIYGDGVNVAARLEAIAEPGGVCVSSIVQESVGSRCAIAFADGGTVTVKSIDTPVRIWTWHPDRDATPTQAPARPAAPGPDRAEQASIAVLAFDNLSGDPAQEYFSDGITEDIITDLSKVGELLVIARNSSFAYKGKSPDIRTVGRELGVGAVLEGSIRRAGDRVRISAQLIDAATGAHLWAERYDRDLTDIFAVQDEVTSSIVEALRIELGTGTRPRPAAAPTRNAEAHDLFLRGREALLSSHNSREMFDFAFDCFSRSIRLDPDYAEPYVGLAHAYNRDFQNRWTGREDSKEMAARYSRIALEKAPDLPYAQYMAGLVRFWDGDLAGAEEAVGRALSVNPNFALAIGLRGIVRVYGSAPLDGIADLEHAVRLDPLMGHQYWHFIGTAYLVAGRYEDAAAAFDERIRRSPGTDLTRGFLIAALGHLGQTAKARQVWDELQQLNPRYAFAEHIDRLPFRDPADADRIRAGFAKAGLAG